MSQSIKNKKTSKTQRKQTTGQNRKTAVKKGRSRMFGQQTNRNLSTGRLGLSGSSRSSTTRHSQVIEEDEYIADINGSVGFVTTAYSINPGQAGTFPWASKIAALYEKYDFKTLEFYYTREVSEFATNGQAGKIMLSCDYDASDSPPTSKQQVLDTVPHADSMPCVPRLPLRIDCNQARNQDSKYVRPGAQPAGTDIKTYDLGQLYVSTQGCTNTTLIGELRVKYVCVLKVPILEPPAITSGSFVIQSAVTGETAAATTVLGALFASATNPVVYVNTIGATIASTGVITVPAGKYLVSGNCLASNSSVAITAANGQFANAASSGGLNGSGTAGLVVTNQTSTHNAWCLTMPSFVFDTSQSGTALCFQAAFTYASGTTLNQANLTIQYLSAVL
jgi:hypothetical protein